MSGKRRGGLIAKEKVLAKDPEFYAKIGRKGGKKSRGGGFTGDSKRAKDGSRHFVGQVYNMKRFRQKLYRINPICQICKEGIDDETDSSLDHILPRAAGGHTVAGNLQLTHKKCNSKKGDKHPYVPTLPRN